MTVKGWCPGAYRPMQSGDGLIVRVRPYRARLSVAQVRGLCDLSARFGNGIIDLTSRANLQVRGVEAAQHTALLQALHDLALLDADPQTEARRNILCTPLWAPQDLTDRLHAQLCARLGDLPEMPAKIGVVLDTGPAPILSDAPGDFRFERTADGALLLRLDGTSRGRLVPEDSAAEALIEAAQWFVSTGGAEARRVARHVAQVPPPAAWTAALPAAPAPRLKPGADGAPGPVLGAAFGSINAAALDHMMDDSGAAALRVTPWRLLILEGGASTQADGFVTHPGDPLLQAHACPGAPACAEATVATRPLARALAARQGRALHVSGCAKGCAFPRAATTTLVGCDGAFDLVRSGAPWDEPCQRGLTPQDLETMTF